MNVSRISGVEIIGINRNNDTDEIIFTCLAVTTFITFYIFSWNFFIWLIVQGNTPMLKIGEVVCYKLLQLQPTGHRIVLNR